MAQGQSLLDTMIEMFASPHPDGYKFVVGGAIATLAAFIVGLPVLGLLLTLATGFISYVFRNPDRVTPLREGLVLAPADGRVTGVDTVRPPAELGLGSTERVRISTSLSLFDVHINRSPVAGRIKRSVYVPGAFGDAGSEKATEENERRAMVVETPQGVEIAVVQIAGAFARRIVSFNGEGESIGAGQRFGSIRFGSRVDLYLPPGKGALIAVGQRMVAGESVVADLKSDEPTREARRV